MKNRIQHFTKLRKEHKYRESEGLALVTGKNLIRELPTIQIIITTERTGIPCEEEIIAPLHVIKKITGLENPEGIAATVSLPKPSDLSDKKRVLVLDRVTDPGNMGTLIRTARALGFEGAYITPGCVDLFNEKALRAAKGATFSFPFSYDEVPEHFTLYLADAKGETNPGFTEPLALVLGNEASGVSSHFSGKRVAITMENFESLNVAVAGGILMHQIREALCAT